MPSFLSRPPPKMAIRIHRREARTARRTKTIITLAFKKVAMVRIKIIKTKMVKIKMVKIKIAAITAEKATTTKTRRVALSSDPAYYSTVKIGCGETLPA